MPREFSAASWSPTALWRDLTVGAIFMTRLPLRHRGALGGAELARASRLFAVVGAVVGCLGGLAYGLASWLGLPPLLAALLAVAATLLITGALHEDGLADVADGFGGGGDRQRKLEIMRDSRIGSYGVAALVVCIGLRVGALASLAEPWRVLAALVAAHALARAFLPAVMTMLSPARSEGLGAETGAPAPAYTGVALGLGVLLAVAALGPERGAVAVVAGAAAAVAMAGLARRQIGGYTGDVLGSVEQAAEVAVLLAVVGMA